MTSNQVRIIGGQWRRRWLRFPDALGLRPTADRVRETVFNWLGQDLSGLSCLDLFSGSGAFGFEAASRGAARVVMIDKSPVVVKALLENAKMLGAGQELVIMRQDGVEFAASYVHLQGNPRFDIVFLDPPYRAGLLAKVSPYWEALVDPAGFVYVEAEAAYAPSHGWEIFRSGRAGQIFYYLMKRCESHGT